MIAHASAELPNECCGLLAGLPDGTVTTRYPLINALGRPTRFESEPKSLFAAEKARRAAGHEFLAVYHSHPTSPAVPSKHDAEQRWGDEILTVIISLMNEAPEVRAWRWAGHAFIECSLEVTEPPTT